MSDKILKFPSVDFYKNGEKYCDGKYITDINDYGEEIHIYGYMMHDKLKKGDVVDMNILYPQRFYETNEDLEEEFVDIKRDFVLYRIERNSQIASTVENIYMFIR